MRRMSRVLLRAPKLTTSMPATAPPRPLHAIFPSFASRQSSTNTAVEPPSASPPEQNAKNSSVFTAKAYEVASQTILGSSTSAAQRDDSATKESPRPAYLDSFDETEVKLVDLKRGDVRETFRASVQARTVGNNQLRKFLRFMNPSDWQMALDAAEGCRDGGLKLDAETNEMLLSLLLRAGQLRQGLELYQNMIQNHICPHTKSYNHLIQLCVEKQSSFAAESLFKDMQKRGRQPDFETYELMMLSFALESPPKWERAIQIFDRLQKTRNKQVSSKTYNALMTVYLNMTPFDYRVVYNAYHEMRNAVPRINFGWDTYTIVSNSLKKGGAPLWTRFATFADAWLHITSVRSVEFWGAAALAAGIFAAAKFVIYQVALLVTGSSQNSESGLSS